MLAARQLVAPTSQLGSLAPHPRIDELSTAPRLRTRGRRGASDEECAPKKKIRQSFSLVEGGALSERFWVKLDQRIFTGCFSWPGSVYRNLSSPQRQQQRHLKAEPVVAATPTTVTTSATTASEGAVEVEAVVAAASLIRSDA